MINKKISYQDEIQKELENIISPPGQKPIHVLKAFTEYNSTDFSKLYILFSIEGGHAFYGKNQNDDSNIQQIIDDFSAFMKMKHLVLYVTPCHLTPNIFLTHAYGNKILAKGEFIPKAIGITDKGKAFINKVKAEGPLIDIKHMSLISRQQYYHTFNCIQQPLVCSHTGVTGISWNSKLDRNVTRCSIKKGPEFVKIKYIKPKGLVKGTFFNPCSINLYDEDILQILSSKGLIGISMDLRIIGGERNILGTLKLNEKEFLSTEEYKEWEAQQLNFAPLNANDFENPYTDQYHWINNQINELVWDEEDKWEELEELNSILKTDVSNIYNKSIPSKKREQDISKERRDEHSLYFLNQIFHIVSVASTAGVEIDPWKHICIGSDFDGFIRAIDCCRSADHLEIFASDLVVHIEQYAQENHYEPPRPAKQLVEDIFFNNCYELMKIHSF